MPWIEPFVSWLANHIPTKDDFNRIEGNILYLNNNKVEKVDGKVLSTNDYTTIEKNKLTGIEAGATGDMSASEILTALKTVDGSGSGLDADSLDGNDSSAFAAASHSHSGYAPTAHASTGTGYGVGTTANFGHCKVRDNLTGSTLVNGESLAAHQGYVLDQKIEVLKTPPAIFSGNLAASISTITDLFTVDISKYKLMSNVGAKQLLAISLANSTLYMLLWTDSNYGTGDRVLTSAYSQIYAMGSSSYPKFYAKLNGNIMTIGYTSSTSGNTYNFRFA